MEKLTAQDLKVLGIPIAILLSVLLLGVISTKLLIDNIFRLNDENSSAQTTETILQSKLNSLQTVNAQVANQSQLSVFALPDAPSVLLAISQIKNQSTFLGLSLNSLLSSDTTQTTGLSRTEIDFELDGSYANIVEFVNKITNSAPITRFDRIKIIGQGGGTLYRISANLMSYWAPLPTALPAVDQPLTTLSAEEEKILSQISALQQPSFTQASSSLPTNPGTTGRLDPFSL